MGGPACLGAVLLTVAAGGQTAAGLPHDRIVPAAAAAGEVVVREVRVPLRTGWTVRWPPAPGAGENSEAAGAVEVVRERDGGVDVLTLRYPVRGWRPGPAWTGPLALEVVEGGVARAWTLPPRRFEVTAEGRQSTLPAPVLPPPPGPPLGPLSAGLALVGALGGAGWAWGRRQGTAKSGAPTAADLLAEARLRVARGDADAAAALGRAVRALPALRAAGVRASTPSARATAAAAAALSPAAARAVHAALAAADDALYAGRPAPAASLAPLLDVLAEEVA